MHEFRLVLFPRINPAPGSESVVVVEYCIDTPAWPVCPTGMPSANAPLDVVKLAVADPGEPLLVATLETVTVLTLPVVASSVLPSDEKPSKREARSDALSVNSGVVMLFVLLTLKDRCTSSSSSCTVWVSLSKLSSNESDRNGSFSTRSSDCVRAVSRRITTVSPDAGAVTKVTLPPDDEPTPDTP